MLRENFGLFFDYQINRLKCFQFDSIIRKAFERQKEEVLNKAMKILVTEDALAGKLASNVPFIPVFSPNFCSVFELAERLQCVVDLNPCELTAKLANFDELYYIFNVSSGEDTKGFSPKNANVFAKKSSKKCLSLFELLSACLHMNIHKDLDVGLCASEYIINPNDIDNCRIPIIRRGGCTSVLKLESALDFASRRSPTKSQEMYPIKM